MTDTIRAHGMGIAVAEPLGRPRTDAADYISRIEDIAARNIQHTVAARIEAETWRKRFDRTFFALVIAIALLIWRWSA